MTAVHNMVNGDIYHNHTKTITVQNGLSPRKFEARNSMITDLMENVHLHTLYIIAWIFIFTSQLHSLVYNIIIYGRFTINLELFSISFSNPYLMSYIWLCMFFASFVPYFGFVSWAIIRQKISKQDKTSLLFCDQFFLVAVISFIVIYTYYFTVDIHQHRFQPAAAVALLLELVRLKMKMYAFVRTNVPHTKNFRHHDKSEIQYPSISKYLYFLFIPTLIYQDEYPRSQSIQWKKVVEHLMNFCGTLILIHMIMNHCTIRFKSVSQGSYTWADFVLIVFEFAPISGVILFTLLYLFFHCWSNLFAELLTFADRRFYSDFWTSKSLERYYRTWNEIVYDWLYNYIYKDFYEIVCPKNKVVARVMVFLVSALYHEFILGFTFRIFTPFVFVIYFTFSLMIKSMKFNHAIGNFIFLFGMSLGSSIIVCGYGIHHYNAKI